MNYIPKQLKYISIVLLVSLILFTAYLIVCPVRTLGKVLLLKNQAIDAEKCYSVSILPLALSGLKNDCLSVNSKHPHDTFIDLKNQSKDDFFSLLSSLQVRRKLGEYHEFSHAHHQENSYSYTVFFHGGFDLTVCLCSEELCFASEPEKRFGSFSYNAYYLVNSPENEEILKEILNFLSAKLTP